MRSYISKKTSPYQQITSSTYRDTVLREATQIKKLLSAKNAKNANQTKLFLRHWSLDKSPKFLNRSPFLSTTKPFCVISVLRGLLFFLYSGCMVKPELTYIRLQILRYPHEFCQKTRSLSIRQWTPIHANKNVYPRKTLRTQIKS